MIAVGPALAKKEERLTSLLPVHEPREECTLPTLIDLLEDFEISDSDAIKDKGKGFPRRWKESPIDRSSR